MRRIKPATLNLNTPPKKSKLSIARIEAAPEVTAYDQTARMVTAMGYRLLIEKPAPQHQVAESGPDTW